MSTTSDQDPDAEREGEREREREKILLFSQSTRLCRCPRVVSILVKTISTKTFNAFAILQRCI